MATTVYEQLEIALQDGTVVTLKPLAIGALRRFQETWEKFEGVEGDNNKSLSIFIELAGIALDKQLTEKIDKRFGDDREITEEYRLYLEDVLDMETIYKIVEICAGIKLNDPNLLAAVAQATAEAGKN